MDAVREGTSTAGCFSWMRRAVRRLLPRRVIKTPSHGTDPANQRRNNVWRRLQSRFRRGMARPVTNADVSSAVTIESIPGNEVENYQNSDTSGLIRFHTYDDHDQRHQTKVLFSLANINIMKNLIPDHIEVEEELLIIRFEKTDTYLNLRKLFFPSGLTEENVTHMNSEITFLLNQEEFWKHFRLIDENNILEKSLCIWCFEKLVPDKIQYQSGYVSFTFGKQNIFIHPEDMAHCSSVLRLKADVLYSVDERFYQRKNSDLFLKIYIDISEMEVISVEMFEQMHMDEELNIPEEFPSDVWTGPLHQHQ